MTVKTDFGTYENCWICVDHYVADNSLNLQIWNESDGPIATITKCLFFARLEEDVAFVDTNNCPWAEDFIKEYQLGKPTGRKVRSGFCEYPVYRFNMGTLRSYM